MRVSECMRREVEIAQADQPIQTAAQLMLRADPGSIPVCEGDRLVGMVTDRDLAVRAVAEGRGPETLLREIMSEAVVCCYEDEDVEVAAQKMSESRVRRIPIASRDSEKLVGIVSLGDITQNDAKLAEFALEGVTQSGSQHNQSAEQ